MAEWNQEYIVLSGARENNLNDVSLRIPKRKITIFTGVSGSGKSSIVFDTIAAESTRLLNENFSMFVRNFLPRVPQPDTDSIENLSMAVIVDQKRLGEGRIPRWVQLPIFLRSCAFCSLESVSRMLGQRICSLLTIRKGCVRSAVAWDGSWVLT